MPVSDIPNRVEQVARDLRAESRDPLCAYIYDLPALRTHIARIVQALPDNCDMFYAVKANPTLPVLQTLAPLVHGFEVASGGELDWVRTHFPTIPVIFGGPGKLESELDDALARNVEVIHVESLLELRRLCTLAERRNHTQDILLRINLELDTAPSTRLIMGGLPTPFGMEEGCIDEALRILAQQKRIRLRGFHFHLLSHQLDAQRHLDLIDRYLATVQRWEQEFGLTIDQINVGGGIGINYLEPSHQFDWEGFTGGLADVLARYQHRPWRIRFECGRALTAACGYYVAEVLDIKACGEEWFAICRGGTHHFRTPAAQSHNHPFQILKTGDNQRDEPAVAKQSITLVGQLCTPKDVFARQVPIPSLSVGDLVTFEYAGAYAWNISHQQFLMHPAPQEVFIE